MSSPPLHIIHVEAGKHLYGGAQQVIYLLRGLQARGHRSQLVCPAGAAVGAAARELGIDVHELGPGGDLDLGFAGRLAKLLRAQQPDLVHLHSRRGADLWGAVAGRRAGVPVVLSRRVDNPENAWLAGLKYRRADRVVAISEGIAKVLRGLGLQAPQLQVARSAVDPTPYRLPAGRDQLLNEFRLPGDATVAGVVAQLIPRKGHRYLFEALLRLRERHPKLHLICFGKGPEHGPLQQVARRLGVADRVQFAGFRTDLPRWVGALDLLVHPALMEGLGIALLQASAAGVPIVACRAGGIPEAVRDGVNGLLVPPADADALAGAISRLLTESGLAERLGKAGRELVDREFSADTMTETNVSIYRDLLASRR